jgi:hypothetical protein
MLRLSVSLAIKEVLWNSTDLILLERDFSSLESVALSGRVVQFKRFYELELSLRLPECRIRYKQDILSQYFLLVMEAYYLQVKGKKSEVLLLLS